MDVLYEDERIIVVDKPHFLATMPRGMWYRQTALIRLRERLGEPDITPAHRLDRMWAYMAKMDVLYEDERFIVVDKPTCHAAWRPTALIQPPAKSVDRMTAGVLMFVHHRYVRRVDEQASECLAFRPISGPRFEMRPPPVPIAAPIAHEDERNPHRGGPAFLAAPEDATRHVATVLAQTALIRLRERLGKVFYPRRHRRTTSRQRTDSFPVCRLRSDFLGRA